MDPRKSFGLTLRELKPFSVGHNRLERLYVYKRLKKAGWEEDPENIAWLVSRTGTRCKKVVKWLAKYRLPIRKWRKYVGKELAPKEADKAAECWVDYVDAAEVVGLDLRNPIFLCPKGLKEKHDEITAAATPIRLERTKKQQSEKMKNRIDSLTKRYSFESDKWLIRPPMSVEEIVAEGKALKHCVGGYADRHVNGKITILFLRSRKRPNVPLVTIEMTGARIVQIHGYRNEWEACKENPKKIDPRELYADILTPWLEWVKAGSKRDKEGRPRLPKKTKKEVHAA